MSTRLKTITGRREVSGVSGDDGTQFEAAEMGTLRMSGGGHGVMIQLSMLSPEGDYAHIQLTKNQARELAIVLLSYDRVP